MAATVAQGAPLSAIEMAAVRAFRDDPATAQNMADVMRTLQPRKRGGSTMMTIEDIMTGRSFLGFRSAKSN